MGFDRNPLTGVVLLLMTPAIVSAQSSIDIQGLYSRTLADVIHSPPYEGGFELGASGLYRVDELWSVGVRYCYQYGLGLREGGYAQSRDLDIHTASGLVRVRHANDFLAGEISLGYAWIRDRGRSTNFSEVSADAFVIEGRILLSRFDLSRSASVRLHGGYRYTVGGAPEIDGEPLPPGIRWHTLLLGFGIEHRFGVDR